MQELGCLFDISSLLGRRKQGARINNTRDEEEEDEGPEEEEGLRNPVAGVPGPRGEEGRHHRRGVVCHRSWRGMGGGGWGARKPLGRSGGAVALGSGLFFKIAPLKG